MEKYRKNSQQGKEQVAIAAAVLTALLAWLGWQIWIYIQGTGGAGVILYALAFLALWVWRYAFRYTYILTDSTLEVVTAGWGLERKFVVDLGSVESFGTEYHKKFFRRTGIKKYINPPCTNLRCYNPHDKEEGLRC